MSEDLIKRSDATKVVYKALKTPLLKGVLTDTLSLAITLVRNIPSADRQKGEWIPCTKEGLPLTELGRREGQKWYGYKCSECNFIYKGNALIESPFCQNCGARMSAKDINVPSKEGVDDENMDVL